MSVASAENDKFIRAQLGRISWGPQLSLSWRKLEEGRKKLGRKANAGVDRRGWNLASARESRVLRERKKEGSIKLGGVFKRGRGKRLLHKSVIEKNHNEGGKKEISSRVTKTNE